MRIWNLAFSQSALNQNRHLTFFLLWSPRLLRPSTLNESSDIIIEISARDGAQDKNALALVSIKMQTRKYSLSQRMKWARQSTLKGGNLVSVTEQINLCQTLRSLEFCVVYSFRKEKKNAVVIWNYIHNVRNPFFFFISGYWAISENTLSAMSRNPTDLLKCITPMMHLSFFTYSIA